MNICFVGGGNMGSALIGGLLRQGFSATALKVIDVAPQSRDRLAADFGVACFDAPTNEGLESDVIVLAVKPQQMRVAVAQIAKHLMGQLVVSIAAGVRTTDLCRWLDGYSRIVRAMPNTPALIGAAVTALYADRSVSETQRQMADKILRAVGSALWVDDEELIDVVTAVAGSGPAYVFYFIDALRQAAVELGLSHEHAAVLSIETFLGASKLAASSDEDVCVLRQRVTSKGGTTEAALEALELADVKSAIAQAVRAAHARGRLIGQMLGKD